MNLDKELQFAQEIAARAGGIALGYQREGVRMETKGDLSPVTAADRASERLIAEAIALQFPSDGILGEEGASRDGSSGRKWIVDPIDGTREFVRGNPAWAVLIGLEQDGESVLGVAHFPALGETNWAARGRGAYCGSRRLHVSAVSELAQAVLCVNGIGEMATLPFAPRLVDWLSGAWAVRAFGGCLDAVMVASGAADAWLEPSGKAWDFAALRVIGEEAGAVFFNFDGGSSIYGGTGVLCTPGLAEALRRFLTC
ncbi:MAG TPA: inositol monophosphatase family protein [Bryobacteraceae bacterium]|nr:inositol monophosphatase family protein [Bryobacteraceae bacterium]